MLKFLVVSIFVLNRLLLAGNDSSGGGNGVVCFNDSSIPLSIRDKNNPYVGQVLDEHINHITSIETLDLYEARNQHGISKAPVQLVPIASTEGPFEYVRRIISRFSRIAPGIAKPLTFWLNSTVKADNVIFELHGLIPIDDTKIVSDIDSKNCVLATMASQYREGLLLFVHIDSRLYNHPKHSKLSQAILLLHEVVYSIARTKGISDSRSTRLFLSHLIRNDGEMLSAFIQSAAHLGFLDATETTKSSFEERTNELVQRDLIEMATHETQYRSQHLYENAYVVEEMHLLSNAISKEIAQCQSLSDCQNKLNSFLKQTNLTEPKYTLAKSLQEKVTRFYKENGMNSVFEEYLAHIHDWMNTQTEIPRDLRAAIFKQVSEISNHLSTYSNDYLFSEVTQTKNPELWIHPVHGKWNPSKEVEYVLDFLFSNFDFPITAMQ